jgi:uncharacterized protein (TIGR02453 family)
MKWFDQEFLTFFAELEANNNKDWFDENRQRYEAHVREPWKLFVTACIEMMADWDAAFANGVQAKDVIFRINRDIRFSKDKTPYKTQVSAGISPDGRKGTLPGLYLEASHRGVTVGGGAYWVEKEDLYYLREKIGKEHNRWAGLIEDPEFKQRYGQVLGERNKRIDKSLQMLASDNPDMYLKQFYYMGTLPSSVLLREDLLDLVRSHARVAEPLRQFLRDGLRSS